VKIAMYNLTTTCRYGGVETFVWEVSRELAHRGHEVHIYGGKGDIIHSIPNVSVRLFPFWRRERVPDLGRRFRKLAERWSMAVSALSPLLRERYDIFHIHKPFDLPVGWMVKKFGKTKLILGSHGTDFFAGDRVFARGVDGAVSCSDYNRELVRRRYGMNPEVIYNGIDPGAFHPFPSPDEELRKKFSLAPGDPVILYVGRLIGLKGLPALLRSFSLLRNRQRARLLIVGDGEGRNSFQNLAQKLGIGPQILWAGFVPHAETPRYYSLASIAVCPSLADEAFGISICEAMACGLPVVASRVGGIPELCLHGETGFLVRAGNEQELAERMGILLEDESLRRKMGAQAARRVGEYFTWERVVDRLMKVYDRLLPESMTGGNPSHPKSGGIPCSSPEERRAPDPGGIIEKGNLRTHEGVPGDFWGLRGNMFSRKKDIRDILPPPLKARHSEYSMIFSLDDDSARPSEYLVSVAMEAVRKAQETNLDDLCGRLKAPPHYPNVWPGEHYKLLAGLMLSLKPAVVVEIGTSMGLSALAMKKYLPAESKILTFDIRDWKADPDYVLRKEDFADGRLVQFLDDLSQPDVFLKYGDILKTADFIFLDASKDGVTEKKFLENFQRVPFRDGMLILLDDIRLWNMLKIWRDISMPKLDITSFGHWSGTGIVEWKPGSRL
jgi:D-inositol-3-phosphate glycosyltransferase